MPSRSAGPARSRSAGLAGPMRSRSAGPAGPMPSRSAGPAPSRSAGPARSRSAEPPPDLQRFRPVAEPRELRLPGRREQYRRASGASPSSGQGRTFPVTRDLGARLSLLHSAFGATFLSCPPRLLPPRTRGGFRRVNSGCGRQGVAPGRPACLVTRPGENESRLRRGHQTEQNDQFRTSASETGSQSLGNRSSHHPGEAAPRPLHLCEQLVESCRMARGTSQPQGRFAVPRPAPLTVLSQPIALRLEESAPWMLIP
jgi:hypothetical protein